MRLRWLRCNLHHLGLAVLVGVGIATWMFSWPLWVLVCCTIVVVGLITDAMARPSSSLFYPTITRGSRRGRQVALTFDDGPDPLVTPKVLDELAATGAKATFFVIGCKLAAHPEIGARILAEGHALGNHSWQHSRLQNFWRVRRHYAEIRRCDQLIRSLQRNHGPALYRPPVGLKSGELARAAGQYGAALVAWSLHSHDTRLAGADRIAARVLRRVRAGDIVLLHDGHDLPGHQRAYCVDALRMILKGLAADRYDCVTVPELLH